MYYAVLGFHILICVFLVLVVLLQHGKGADIGATFGGSSQTVFGARGAATVLSKITVGAAFVFMVTSIGLAHLSSSGSSKSLLAPEPKSAATAVPATPSPSASPSAAPTKAPEKTKAPAKKK